MGETMLIKNVGVQNLLNDSGMHQICLTPILNHIQTLGKNIFSKSISYYSDKDQMEVFVGKHPIDPHYAIPMDDFTEKLKLKITQQAEPLAAIKRPIVKSQLSKRLFREVAYLQGEDQVVEGKRARKTISREKELTHEHDEVSLISIGDQVLYNNLSPVKLKASLKNLKDNSTTENNSLVRSK